MFQTLQAFIYAFQFSTTFIRLYLVAIVCPLTIPLYEAHTAYISY